jgi:uncharacterized circularly permuted ATP-grasp superfamily protein
MIRYYLGEDPILPNVPSWRCEDPKHLQHVLANLHSVVVKPVDGSGGYGMLMGPKASRGELEQFAAALKAEPRHYIAQPVITLSTVPTFIDDQLVPRHVDLRPFILSGENTYVTMGGLTRVALRQGSLVVNSSQGGGSKDTWIVDTGD